eukprot:108594-Prymnesium_polylepis.1
MEQVDRAAIPRCNAPDSAAQRQPLADGTGDPGAFGCRCRGYLADHTNIHPSPAVAGEQIRELFRQMSVTCRAARVRPFATEAASSPPYPDRRLPPRRAGSLGPSARLLRTASSPTPDRLPLRPAHSAPARA